MATVRNVTPHDTYADTYAAPMRAPWEEIVGAYLVEVSKRSGSKRTPADYARLLSRFLETVPDWSRVTPAQVHGFAYAPGPSGRSPSASTISVRLAALSGFYGFARRMGLVQENPAREVARPRQEEPTPRGLEAEEIRRLLDALPRTSSGLRDRAIVLTAVLTGLRRSEVMALRVGDLTRNGHVYYRARVKGGRERHRELPLPAFSAIVEALQAAGTPLEGLAPEARLFPVSGHGFYANLQRAAVRAGLSGVTPHVLRHSAAKLRRDSGASLEEVAALLGHRSLHTTARYLARLEGERDTGWGAVAASLGVGV